MAESAEGGRLLSDYTGSTCIEGSNPSLSVAKQRRYHARRGTFFIHFMKGGDGKPWGFVEDLACAMPQAAEALVGVQKTELCGDAISDLVCNWRRSVQKLRLYQILARANIRQTEKISESSLKIAV